MIKLLGTPVGTEQNWFHLQHGASPAATRTNRQRSEKPDVARCVPASLSMAFLSLHTRLAGFMMARLSIVAAR